VHPQELELLGEDSSYGLKGEFENGKFLRAVYICKNPECRGKMYDHNKMELLQTGGWVETVHTGNPKYISRQINSLYSPEGWLSWDDLYRKYLSALEEPNGMRSFKPLYLGLPFEETGTAPKFEKVIENRGTYKPRDVPQGVLYICAGADVQEGSAKDPDRPARIEIEVCGFGYGMRTWSLCYEIFRGEVDDPFGGAWAKMNEWAINGGLYFQRADGVAFPVSQIFIDSGYIPEVVYRFCSQWQSTFPSKGFATLTADSKKKERGEIPGAGSYIRKRAHVEKGGQVLYEVNTSYYKGLFYSMLKVPREPLPPQKSGFCDFPYSYPESYFKQLTAAKMLQNRTFHSVGPDEALDCRVYCLAASEVYLENYVLNVRAEYQRQGVHPQDLQKITTRYVIDRMIERFGWPPGLPPKPK
jgi:phage terminase large subunit GpA-like protein